jgi:diaminohydroxyphosphoribosylaminopyrimidine deaminase/5-amino-6-(5-phosphoribosylamino)uracil reductase
MTLDGKIATASGESRWITGTMSRREAHRLRGQADAVLVGVGTVVADDPSLTARTGAQLRKLAPRQPLRIVVDSRLRAPSHAKVLARQQGLRTLVATTRRASAVRAQALRNRGIEVMVLPAAEGGVSLPALVKELGRRGIVSLLVEGGSEIASSMLKVTCE